MSKKELGYDLVRGTVRGYSFEATSVDYDCEGEGWSIAFPETSELDLEELRELASSVGCELEEVNAEELEDWREQLRERHANEDEENNDSTPCEVDSWDLETCRHKAESLLGLESYLDLEELTREELEEWLGENQESFAPMMNYLYPAPQRASSTFANEVAGTCFTVVVVNGETCLALTGGGMDMRWDICSAYVSLGFLPPYEMCDLPYMSGRGESESDIEIMKACRDSADHVSSSAGYTLGQLIERIREAEKGKES